MPRKKLPGEEPDSQMTEPIYAIKVLLGEIYDPVRRSYKPPIKDDLIPESEAND